MKDIIEWVKVKDRLPNEGEYVLASYMPVYKYRVVRYWCDGKNHHFGDINSDDGMGSQPAKWWAKLNLPTEEEA